MARKFKIGLGEGIWFDIFIYFAISKKTRFFKGAHYFYIKMCMYIYERIHQWTVTDICGSPLALKIQNRCSCSDSTIHLREVSHQYPWLVTGVFFHISISSELAHCATASLGEIAFFLVYRLLFTDMKLACFYLLFGYTSIHIYSYAWCFWCWLFCLYTKKSN